MACDYTPSLSASIVTHLLWVQWRWMISGIANCPSDHCGVFFSIWCLIWAVLIPSLLIKQDICGVREGERRGGKKGSGEISVPSLSLLYVLSLPSPSPYRGWVTTAGVAHHSELVPSVQGGAVGRGLTSLHISPGHALSPQSQRSQEPCIMRAGFQEWCLARSFSVWGQCSLLVHDHRKKLYTWQPESIFTTHTLLWTCWPVEGPLPLSLAVLPHGQCVVAMSHPCLWLSRTAAQPGAGWWRGFYLRVQAFTHRRGT